MWLIVGVSLVVAATSTEATPGALAKPGVFPSEAAVRAYAHGLLLESDGQLREALAEYARGLVLDPGAAPIARRAADLEVRLGDPAGALDYADKALAAAPGDPASLEVRGSALLALGRTEEALPAFQSCVAADSTSLNCLQLLARTAELLDRVDIVASAYGRAVQLDEDDPESWFQLAAAQARLGRFEEADKSLDRARELAPVRPGQLFLQGWIDENLGRHDEAIDAYRHHLQIHPDDPTTRRRLIRVLGLERRWNEALTEARELARRYPSDMEALELQAEAAYRAGKNSEARSTVDRMQKWVEDDPDRLGAMCMMLVRIGQPVEAAKRADGWLARHPDDARGAMLAARVRALAGDRAAAVPFARRAVEAAPDSLLPRLVLAQLLTDTRQYEEAESTLVKASELRPSNVAVLLALGELREQRGDQPGAEAAARDALKIEPDNPRVMNALGYLLADHNRSLEEAESLIRRAVAADSDNGAYVDSLGWVYYRLGRLEAAREQLERAVELTEGDAVVREHLGDVYRDLKMTERARDQYRLSLAKDGSNSRVRAKLSQLVR